LILFFDASALIYRFEGVPAFQSAAVALVAELVQAHPEARPAISRLSRLECRVKPLREKNQALLARYERFFADPELQIVELDGRVIDLATHLRAKNGLKTPDALQAACALALSRAVSFITGDAEFERVKGLQVRRIVASNG
jgi:predicted nucleic acid-binding protein